MQHEQYLFSGGSILALAKQGTSDEGCMKGHTHMHMCYNRGGYDVQSCIGTAQGAFHYATTQPASVLYTVQEVYLHLTTWYLVCAMESRLYTADWPGKVTKAAPCLDLYKHAP